MQKKICCFKLLVLLTAAVILISSMPEFCFAARGGEELSRDYQLESEKKHLKDNFSWEIDLVYGLSSVSRLLGLGARRFPDGPSKEYLDTLKMTNSNNDFLLTLGANYLITPKLELSLGVPVSIVMVEVETGSRRKTKHPQLKAGVGDIYASISYALLTESKSRPLVISTFEVKSPLSKYTSMGDGFWGFTPGVYLRKFISGSMYALGLAGYTFRLQRRGAEPEAGIRYGGGFGFLSGDKKLELTLERTRSGKTKLGDKVIMDSGSDLILGASLTTILARQTCTIGVFLSGLEKGLNWGKNSAGAFIGVSF
ncbi:MAG: hypothetical protein M0R66_02735 [Candidatus Omnitrophica bacterium]|nr:hypothetical protein [Candidatus Omnitrophota bacterium]